MLANVILNLILMQFLLHAGLALATALAAWLNVGLLSWILHRRGYLIVDRRSLIRLVRIVGASLLMGLLLWILKESFDAMFTGGEAERLFGLLILVVVGLTSYTLAAQLLHAISLREVKDLLARRQ